jgi:iron complex outermembrane receptor protein
LFYTKEAMNYFANYTNTIPPSLQPIPGPDGQIVGGPEPSDYKEEAAFADLTYYFSDSIDLTLGGRYSHNRQEVSGSQFGFAAYLASFSNSSSDSDFTYLAALRWRPTATLNTYARIASSYRPGGPEQFPLAGNPTTFKADSLVNYEVGVKGEWLDGRVRTNLALYDMKWKDVQMTSNVAGYSLISNGGQATVKGVELETQFVPIERLSLGFNVAYTHARLDTVSASVTTATGAVAGDSLPFTPSWSASAVADYALPLNGSLTSTYGLTYRYQGNKWSDYPGDAFNTGVVIPHYDTLDIRTGVSWSRYQLQARVANLFNSHGLDTVVDQRISGNPAAWAAIIPPRTFVLSFIAKF